MASNKIAVNNGSGGTPQGNINGSSFIPQWVNKVFGGGDKSKPEDKTASLGSNTKELPKEQPTKSTNVNEKATGVQVPKEQPVASAQPVDTTPEEKKEVSYYDAHENPDTYEEWDTEDLIKQIQALEKTGWDNKSYENDQLYVKLVDEVYKRKKANGDDDVADWEARSIAAHEARDAHNKQNFNSNYQEIIDSARKRREAENALKDSEGRYKNVYSILAAYKNGEFGNYSKAKNKKDKIYKMTDADGNHVTYTDRKTLDRMNRERAESIKKYWHVSEPDENEKVRLEDKDGQVYKTFDSKKDAEKFINNYYSLDENDSKDLHYVEYDGEKHSYDSEDAAKDVADKINKETAKERRNAKATAWYYGLDATANFLNNHADRMGGGSGNAKSAWEQEMDRRAQNNSDMYYKNETAKNDNIRNIIALADRGIIDLNDYTNKGTAAIVAAYGEDNVRQANELLNKQRRQLFNSQIYGKLSPEVRTLYSQWKAMEGAGPADETLIAYSLGQISPTTLRQRYETNFRKDSLEVQAVEEAVKKAGLENTMTKAQVDVIKELVAEQLKAAQLANDQARMQMATSAVDSVAKIVGAVVPKL